MEVTMTNLVQPSLTQLRQRRWVVVTILSCLTLSIQSNAAASSDIDQMCRIQAKEIAATKYRTCITENKTAQIEKLKKDYQSELNKIKAHYEGELNKLKSSKKKVATAKATKSSQGIRAELSVQTTVDSDAQAVSPNPSFVPQSDDESENVGTEPSYE
jgi:Skp family chaperone for outer membrane proteins